MGKIVLLSYTTNCACRRCGRSPTA